MSELDCPEGSDILLHLLKHDAMGWVAHAAKGVHYSFSYRDSNGQSTKVVTATSAGNYNSRRLFGSLIVSASMTRKHSQLIFSVPR